MALMTPDAGDGDFMTPAEVASAFHVDSRTVARWAKAGKLPSVLTPGGHRRYPAAQVWKLLSYRVGGSRQEDGRR